VVPTTPAGIADRASSQRRPAVEKPAFVTSSMERRKRAEEGEVVEGYVTVEFAAGARWGAAHLAFCPPLAGDPRITTARDEELVAEIKVTQALRYAARFDVRLSSPAEEPFSFRVWYRVTTDAARPGEGLPDGGRPDDLQP
jgi:hypothetical protein